MMTNEQLAKALFSPKKIAIVGASSNINKASARPQRYLFKHNFQGKVYPVNPNNPFVQGIPAYPDVQSLPDGVEHLFIMAPSEYVEEILQQAVMKKIKIATIYSNGFAETGAEGQRRQARILEIARLGNLRLLGPNSMGVINTHSNLTLSVNAILEIPKLLTGNIGLISQSGTIIGALMSRGYSRHIGFSKLISVGNESDLGVSEIAELLLDDPQTDVIVLFLEGIRNAKAIIRMARRAYKLEKPVIAYKLGRSEIGQKLAATHSGALAGNDRCVQTLFDHCGIIRADMFEELVESPFLFQRQKPAAGRRVSVLTTTGGGAAIIIDHLGRMGLDVVGPEQRLRDQLTQVGLELGAGPLIDLTMVGMKDGIFKLALESLMRNDECDAVVAVVGSSGQFHPELIVSPIISCDVKSKFFAVFITPEAILSLEKLSAAGIAAFRAPETCASAIRSALMWKKPKQNSCVVPDMSKINDSLSLQNKFDERDASNIFAMLMIPQSKSWKIVGEDIPKIDYPVAVKILSEDVVHKANTGGVRLGIKSPDSLRLAMMNISADMDKLVLVSKPYKFLVQPMHTGVVELLLGYRDDPEAGPVILLGAGGKTAELLNDVVTRIAPIDRDSAVEMIGELNIISHSCGLKTEQKADLEALADVIVSMSKLAFVKDQIVYEAEINPLVVKELGKGVVAVDGVITLKKTSNVERFS